MSNPFMPVVPVAAGSLVGDITEDSSQAVADGELIDDDETSDDQDTVDRDLREADSVNKKLEE